MSQSQKLNRLKEIIRSTGGLAVAFSGGVDSTFLAAVASQELGDRAIAVNALSPTYPSHEHAEAKELAEQIGIKLEIVESNELEIPEFSDNPVDRCYYCKRELFSVVKDIAAKYDIHKVADGTNYDDLSDHRPGRRAAAEGDVLSPLLEAEMTKDDIRECSRAMGLATADKPAFACLASRFPYGSSITQEKLSSIDALEASLRELGVGQLRVRHHGEVARIEVEPSEISRLADESVRAKIVAAAKAAGFLYVTLDLEGYRTGSMNEGL